MIKSGEFFMLGECRMLHCQSQVPVLACLMLVEMLPALGLWSKVWVWVWGVHSTPPVGRARRAGTRDQSQGTDSKTTDHQ
jgi:hypothetical protein